jgi:hypothetical protein
MRSFQMFSSICVPRNYDVFIDTSVQSITRDGIESRLSRSYLPRRVRIITCLSSRRGIFLFEQVENRIVL